MEKLLPDKGTAHLFHGVCEEALAALIITLAKQKQSRTTLLIVNKFARAQKIAAEIETLTHWLLPGRSLEILFFPEEPKGDLDTAQQADRIYERSKTLRALLSAKRNHN